MKKVSVPQPISAGLKEFLTAKDISIEIVTEDADLKIEETGAERLESTLSTLYSGGWTTCETARATAKNLDITLAQMGEILDHLKVKVKQCGLGCF
jgi:hypothetical protein